MVRRLDTTTRQTYSPVRQLGFAKIVCRGVARSANAFRAQQLLQAFENEFISFRPKVTC